MYIATRFKRPNAPINIEGTDYFFRPSDPVNADSTHVAFIENKQHVSRLLAIPEGYYLPEDHELPKLAARPSAAPPAPPAPVPDPTVLTPAGAAADGTGAPPPAPAPASTAVNELPEEIRDAAKALNELSWQKLKAELAKQPPIDKVVIQEALRIEEAKPKDEQHSAKLKQFQAALEGG